MSDNDWQTVSHRRGSKPTPAPTPVATYATMPTPTPAPTSTPAPVPTYATAPATVPTYATAPTPVATPTPVPTPAPVSTTTTTTTTRPIPQQSATRRPNARPMPQRPAIRQGPRPTSPARPTPPARPTSSARPTPPARPAPKHPSARPSAQQSFVKIASTQAPGRQIIFLRDQLELPVIAKSRFAKLFSGAYGMRPPTYDSRSNCYYVADLDPDRLQDLGKIINRMGQPLKKLLPKLKYDPVFYDFWELTALDQAFLYLGVTDKFDDRTRSYMSEYHVNEHYSSEKYFQKYGFPLEIKIEPELQIGQINLSITENEDYNGKYYILKIVLSQLTGQIQVIVPNSPNDSEPGVLSQHLSDHSSIIYKMRLNYRDYRWSSRKGWKATLISKPRILSKNLNQIGLDIRLLINYPRKDRVDRGSFEHILTAHLTVMGSAFREVISEQHLMVRERLVAPKPELLGM